MANRILISVMHCNCHFLFIPELSKQAESYSRAVVMVKW